jgi:hypothetical protein
MPIVAVLAGCFSIQIAGAQTLSPDDATQPGVGASGGEQPPILPKIIVGSSESAAKMHLGPTGKPCLTVLGYAKPQIVNPDLFDHLIDVSNDCSEQIKLQVCYYQSEHCIPMNIPGYGEKEAVLGVYPHMDDFRFEFREKFDDDLGLRWTPQ